ERGLRRAKDAGLVTVLNPAPADAAIGRRELACWVDILTPNEVEAATLARLAAADLPSSQADPTQMGRRLQELGFAKCVITLGPAGCLVFEDQVVAVPGNHVQAIDATAAGDAFNGALAVALSERRSLVEAARWANRAAAIAVTRRGAQPSLPTRAEIEAGNARPR
ncbi:MAG TPA: PfkB family carbohydrate kinase, partial [Pirellulales bacterium]|nr:PfkB family carbohydrate kinase [Pirellulales bacterium]